jgi:L-ascorbate metabolism protein UlaG (beta-lactamase superfamily)
MEEKVTIRLIRNATLRIHYAGKEILVDPMLAGKDTLQSALGVYKTPRVHLTMPMNEIADGLDMVLLTHNHIDHYDPTVKQHLAKNILFLTQPQDKESITQDGFTNVESIEKDKAIGNLTIHRIQGHHGFGKIGATELYESLRPRRLKLWLSTAVRLCETMPSSSPQCDDGS